jgi:hypothetical protein
MPIGTFLNGTTPARLRGLLWLSLSETGNVLAATSTSDSGGGATVAWVAGTAVPCRIDPINAFGKPDHGRRDRRALDACRDRPARHERRQTDNRFSITGRGTFEITAVRQLTAEFLLWHSNAPWSPTGYGQQTGLFLPIKEHYEVAVSSFYGLEGAPITWEGIPVFPGVGGQFGDEHLVQHAKRFFGGDPRGGLVVTLMDVWVLDARWMSQLNARRGSPSTMSRRPRAS